MGTTTELVSWRQSVLRHQARAMPVMSPAAGYPSGPPDSSEHVFRVGDAARRLLREAGGGNQAGDELLGIG